VDHGQRGRGGGGGGSRGGGGGGEGGVAEGAHCEFSMRGKTQKHKGKVSSDAEKSNLYQGPKGKKRVLDIDEE